jgi:hypothetical protein
MYGEGLCEEIFLKHLKGIYYRSRGVAIKIEGGRGGSAPDIVTDAVKMLGSFDRKVVILDNDKLVKEMAAARAMATSYGIILIENNPCLEATLLAVLMGDKFPKGKASEWYKKEFESKYIDKKKRADFDEYKKIFSKNTLDVGRAKVREIDALIILMEGK